MAARWRISDQVKISLTLALATTALIVAGCGGSSPTYSRSALVACLQQHGVRTFGTNVMSPAQKATFFKIIGTANFVGAKFAGGETDAFIFAANAAGAKKIEGRVTQFAQSPLASAGRVKSKGNVVLLTPVHSTSGVQEIISSCESSAQRT